MTNAKAKPQPSPVAVPGALVQATLIASDELFLEFEKPRRDNFGHHVANGCVDQIQGYDVSIKELPEAYVIELSPGALCPSAAGGGGRWHVDKESFRLLAAEHFE